MGRMRERERYRYAECQRVVYPQRVEYLDHHQRHLFFPSCLVAVAVCVQGFGIRD